MFDFTTPITKDTYLKAKWSCPGQLNPPDLSEPLTPEQYADLQEVVYAGKASEYYNLGDTILVPYGEWTMPFEIVGFEDIVAQVDGEDRTVHAIQLLSVYTDETGSQWGASGSTKYSASYLRTQVTVNYQNSLDSNFVVCLANTKVQTYSRDGATDIVYDRLFAPSLEQIGVTDALFNTPGQVAVEGPPFTAYEDVSAAARVKQAINATDTAQTYWTRSLYTGWQSWFVGILTNGSTTTNYYDTSYRIVAAGNFIGTSTPAPASYTVTFEADGATNVPAPQTVAAGGVVSEPEPPIKDGYTFENWLLNGEVYDFSTPVTQDITLIAEFVQAYDPSNPTLGGLKAAMQAGDYSAFPAGTEIPDTYAGQSNPLIVAQYLDSSNNSSYGGAEGVILVRKYVEPTSQQFDGNIVNWNYSASKIKQFLESTYYNNSSEELKAIMSTLNIPYYNGSTIVNVPSTWFLMADNEMCSNRQPVAEGVIFEYWKEKTGLSSPDYNANNGRIVTDRSGTPQSAWLRTRSNIKSGQIYYVCFDTTIGIIGAYSPPENYGVLPACFIAKD